MNLEQVVGDIVQGLMHLDAARECQEPYKPGIGPFKENELVRRIAKHLNNLPHYAGKVLVKRKPDLLIDGHWAMEFKLARPYGDNGKEAENWSVNLLHPYPGNASSVGDCFKLIELPGMERKAVVVIGYEHTPVQRDLTPLIKAFEVVAREVAKIAISARVECRREGLVHPVHQCVRVFAWEVLGRVQPD